MPQRKRFKHSDEQHFATQLGVRIQFLRLERGLSLRDVPALAGCCVSTLTSIEHRKCVTTMNTLKDITKALNVRPFDLLNYDTNESGVGILLEAMRPHSECMKKVNEHLSALA